MAVLAVAMTAPLTVREMLQVGEKAFENRVHAVDDCEAVFAAEVHDRLDELLAEGCWEAPAEEPLFRA